MPQPTVDVGVSYDVSHWRAYKNDLERALDAAPLLTAHPEETLVLAGPPHKPPDGRAINLTVLGMLQMFNVASASPVTPLLGLGSSRQFYSASKSQNQVTLARLVFNNGNLLYKLYENILRHLENPDGNAQSNLDTVLGFLRRMDEPALPSGSGINTRFLVNLDSPLFGIPIGLGTLFRTKVGLPVGGLYVERAKIQAWNIAFASGQNVVAENCSLLADRILPFDVQGLTGWEDDDVRQVLEDYVDDNTNKDHAAGA